MNLCMYACMYTCVHVYTCLYMSVHVCKCVCKNVQAASAIQMTMSLYQFTREHKVARAIMQLQAKVEVQAPIRS